MSSNKRITNPLLGPASSNFCLSDSFGSHAAVLVPSAMNESAANTSSTLNTDAFPQHPVAVQNSVFNVTSPVMDPFANVRDGTGPANFQTSSPAIGQSLAPPVPGLFLLPQSGPIRGAPLPPPPSASLAASGSPYSLAAAKIPPPMYRPPPGLAKSSTASDLVHVPPEPTAAHPDPYNRLKMSTSFSSLSSGPLPDPVAATPKTFSVDASSSVLGVAHHWFFQVKSSSSSLLSGSSPVSAQEVWKPFSMIDSVAIEDAFLQNPNSSEPLPTDGGRYDVIIKDRIKSAVYWKEEEDELVPIRRCSWFYKCNADGRWVPFDEPMSLRLEKEFVSAKQSGNWNRKLEVGQGEHIVFHSESVIMHFPSSKSTLSGSLDEWGQVQLPQGSHDFIFACPPQDPSLRPREVHRGLEGLPEIPDGECPEVDHLVFIIHGIGSVCDMKFRSITQVVDGFRELAQEMSERHFQSANLAGKLSRVEFLPVNWHSTLHGEDTGTDNRLKPLTLKSIPKLRNFVNETLLDILFYTSPIYCQTIVNTVVSELNRMYTLFMARNEHFRGQVSIIGHSLGSLITFDILSHQVDQTADVVAPVIIKPRLDAKMDLEQVFQHLGLSEYAATFTNEGIDLDAMMLCTDDDLREGGLPDEGRAKLLQFLHEHRNNHSQDPKRGGLEAFQQNSVESDVKYMIGPAGTGQPSVHYPALSFKLSAFFALGSPIGMFMAVRGIECLGPDFSLPTCAKFYNIFHPFDPVAYRVEGLIKQEYGLHLRPVTIPHHKGRKRMHLEIKDTVTRIMSTDFKQKIIDSVSSTLNAIYAMAGGGGSSSSYQSSAEATQVLEKAVQQEMEQKAQESDELDSSNPQTIQSRLNQGRRIDYALQEAPFESFNEYLFALASHLCYWESEDVCLMILKEIYSDLQVFADDQPIASATGTMSRPASVPYLQPATQPGLAPYVIPPATMVSKPLVSEPGVSRLPAHSRPVYVVASPPGMGMDPTAPPSHPAAPIGPPPTAGFVRKH